MPKLVDLEELIDAADVAEIVGVAHPTSIGIYRKRYDDFPAPIWASRGGRCQLWLRPDVEAWARATGRLD